MSNIQLNIAEDIKNYILSRGMNLITNGFGLLGNNYNFEQFTYDTIEKFGGAGSFKIAYPYSQCFTSEFIQIDTYKAIRGVAWVKSTVLRENNRAYFGIVCYDSDKLQISSWHHMQVGGSSHTVLADDLEIGDTIIALDDATGWYALDDNTYTQIAFWPYTNLSGYVYPNYSYTRNTSVDWWFANAGIWGSIIGNNLQLKVPWAGPEYPAGTPVANCKYGGTYLYGFGANVEILNEWTKLEGVIQGLDVLHEGSNYKFPYGTDFIKLLFLSNYGEAADPTNVMNWSAIWLSEITDENL